MKAIALIFGLLVIVAVWLIARAESQAEQPGVSTPQLSQPQPDIEPAASQPAATPTTLPAETAVPVANPVVETNGLALQPADLAQAAGFGTAVAHWGDTLVVGAPQSDKAAGAVHLFNWDGQQWQETARLTASDGVANDNFGRSVAISGQTILVGASGHSAAGWQAGAVYVFELGDGRWQQTAKLLPASTQDIRFGWAVALAGETAVIGAPYRYSQGEMLNVGSATIFSRQGQEWQQQTRLTTGQGGGAVANDLFGWAVAVAGDTVAVGAYLQESVYVYEEANGQWRETAVLRDSSPGSQFGYSIALDADRLLVGAPASGRVATRAGTAVLYIYQPEGSWAEVARLAPGNLRPGSRFGSAVAVAGEVIAVGMRESDGRADMEESGGTIAFRFANGQAAPIAEFYAPQPASFAHLGTAVAVSANTVFTGAPGHENTSGTVYTFSLK